MSADHRLTAFSTDGLEVYRMSLERDWLASLAACGFAARTADIGESILVTVVVVTAAELRRVNEHARARRCASCAEVDVVLVWAGGTSYFSPWFVIESADID